MNSASSRAFVQNAEDARAGVDERLPPFLLSSSSSFSTVSSSPVPSHYSPVPSPATSQSRQRECWICFDTRTLPTNPMVSHRCRCRGSVGFVHQKCIDRWVIQQHNRTCVSCGATYRLEHSAYPPDAHLPLDPKGRRAFLFQFLMKPIAKEVAEAVLCVALRFFYVPALLGIIYNFHRAAVLLWIVTGDGKWWGRLSSAPAGNPTLLWLFNADVAAATNGEVGYTVCLSAWADTLLFGMILCAVINAVTLASHKWEKYFRDARRQHERELASHEQEHEQQHQHAAAAADAVREDTASQDRTTEDNNTHAAQTAEVVGGRHTFFREPLMEGWRPEWGPVPVDTDFEPNARDEVRGNHDAARIGGGPRVEDTREDRGRRWWDGDNDTTAEEEGEGREEGDESSRSDGSSRSSSDDEGDDDTGSDATDDDSAARFSFVDEMFDLVSAVKAGAGGGGLRRLLPVLMVQLRYGVVLTFFLRCPLGRIVLSLAFVALLVGWRYCYSRNTLAAPKRRFEEVAEQVPLLSPEAVRTLFYVYLVDAFFYYCVLPEMGGVMLHYALAPYLDIGMNDGVVQTLCGLTVWRIGVYWGIGAMLVMLLTAMELTVVSPLFANGVELFFVRSFDARWDSVLGYWRCVVSQVFDTDPPRILFGFLRVATVELLVLLIFVRMPFWGMLSIRDAVWGDGTTSLGALSSSSAPPTQSPTKLAFSLGISGGYDVDQDFTFSEWRRAEVLQLLDEKVLMPFGEIYAEMIGSHRSFLEGRNMSAPLRMDPLVAAATFVTNATPAEMWAEVWGNMSDSAVFTFDLIDPTSAARVAQQSEGFRDTLARVRAPLEWLRQATLRGSICDTLTALSSPDGVNQEATQRVPAVDVEGLLHPPNIVLPFPSAAAVRNRQMIVEAWRHAHYQAVQHIKSVARNTPGRAAGGLHEDGLRRSSRMHTVNIVNCYVTFLQVTQPFVRMGRWHTIVLEWWSMLLVRSVHFNYGMFLFLYMVAFFTALTCFGVFPLQRAQLRLLQPFVQWVGRHVVCMEDYLFDPEQTRAVEEFMRSDEDDELVLPPMAEPLGFNRREDYIDGSLIPSHVVLRRAVISVLFFVAASLMVWTVPVLCGSLLLSFTTNALPVLLGATLLSFFIWSPSLLGRSLLFGSAFFFAFAFAIPILFMVYVAPMLQRWWNSYPTLVEETFQRHYNIRQTVGRFIEYEEAGSNHRSSSSNTSDWSMEEGYADEAESEWESVDSNGEEPM
jgi:hypothetical protein